MAAAPRTMVEVVMLSEQIEKSANEIGRGILKSSRYFTTKNEGGKLDGCLAIAEEMGAKVEGFRPHVPMLLLLFVCSIVGCGMDVFLRCRQSGLVIQLTVQALLMVLPSSIFVGTENSLPIQPGHHENMAVEVPHVESAAEGQGALPDRKSVV